MRQNGAWNGKTWVRVRALPFSSCRNLGKSLNLGDSLFPHLENGAATCSPVRLRGLSEKRNCCVKSKAQFPR